MQHTSVNTTHPLRLVWGGAPVALALGLLGAAVAPASAQAPIPAFSISGGLEQTAQDYGDTSYSLGYAFTVNSPLSLTALGYYDDGMTATRMQQSHAVGLFDSHGNLLVQGTVTTADPYSDLFRYTSTLSDAAGHGSTIFTLQPGQTYVAAAVTGSDEFVNVGPSFGGTFSADPAVTFVEDRTYAANADGTGSHNTSTLTFPEFSNHNDYFGDGSANYGYFGPNIEVAAAPEPSEAATLTLAAIGLVGLLLRAHRRSTARNHSTPQD